jgi:hypothetical protein
MAIETLFGPSVADVQELRRLQQEREIAGAGSQFGAFAPLYQAGLRFGNQAVQSVNTLMGAQDPMLKKATDIQSILSKYQDQDLTDAKVLTKISKDLAGKGYAAESIRLAQEARNTLLKEEELGLRKRGVDIQERGVGVQEGTLQVSKDRLKKDIDDAKRQERLTEAQIKKINAEIANLGDDRYSFNLSKDALGNLVEIIAINKSNPSDMKRIKISEPATSAAADPAAAARAELERRKKGKTSTMSTSSVPELDVGVSP